MEKSSESEGSITQLAILTACFMLALAVFFGLGRHTEIMENWEMYRSNPLYMMTAFMYKPPEDPRSRFQFMQDNFTSQLTQLVRDTLQIVLVPIMDIFQLTTGGIIGSMNGSQAIRKIMQTMMESFNKIFEIFENRYKSVMYRFAMTFQRLQTSFSRIWGVAASSLYQSMATVNAIRSTLDLIIKIVIIILVILVAIIIFLFLFLWPVIPVILGVVGILVTAGMGAAVGGMASTFCFDGATPVVLADGSTKPMASLKIGEELGEACGSVTATLKFLQFTQDLFILDGIRVTGSHIVWEEGRPIPVAKHPRAKPCTAATMRLFCLNTASNRIPIRNATGSTTFFADWEELGTENQLTWNRYVHTQLNPGATWQPDAAVVTGEAGFHPATIVQTGINQWTEISRLRPGDTVLDEHERVSRVLGVVELAGTEVCEVTGCMSVSVWRRMGYRTAWQQGITGLPTSHAGTWHSIITDHGTFRIITGETVRDFTDVGISHIHDTYGWVLEALGSQPSKTDP